MLPLRSLKVLFLGLVFSSACAEALYPPRPPRIPGPALADPPSSRVTMHISLTGAGIEKFLEGAVPAQGEVPFTLLGPRKLLWRRSPFELRFNQQSGTLGVVARIDAVAELPLGRSNVSLMLLGEAQPVLSSDYIAQLQAPQVQITSDDVVLRAAEWGVGVLGRIRSEVEQRLRGVRLDLRPLLAQGYLKLAQPLTFQVGQANACLKLGLQSLEAGPTVLAGGFEKDLAVVVAPSVTLPCTSETSGAPTLPPLHNVAGLPTGPFDLIVPVAATYDELQKAMTQAFTDGKLYFSQEFPDLYLERPEIYASGGQVVTKLHLAGTVKKGFRVKIEGDLYMAGHPEVRDNELQVPDAEPTIETQNALLKLKTRIDAAGLKRQVREALRLDIGARIQAVRSKLAQDLHVKHRLPGNVDACVDVDVGRVEVTGVYAHDAYLRLYLKLNGRSAAYLPCPP